MEWMNDDVFAPTRHDTMNTECSFKQDPKLVVAIDKLYGSMRQAGSNLDGGRALVLPNRKMEFHEVRQLLSQATSSTAETRPEQALQEQIDARKNIIKKIEDILSDINRSAESGEVPKLEIRNQRLWSNCVYDLDRVTLKCIGEAKKSTLVYSDGEQRARFNRVVFVLTKMHQLMNQHATVTRRELFYQNVSRFRSQSSLDESVRDACCLLEEPPWSLGILATAKGLVAGPLQITTSTGAVIDCMQDGGTLIPQDIGGLVSLRSSAKYILVVEKDAVFQKLLDDGALLRLGPVIIVTGKGYPDVCTRLLVSRLSSRLRLPALALVDADPHGLEIFLTYKFGSLALSHLSSSLACSSLRLLGARHTDVMTLAAPETRLPLSPNDHRKLRSLLARPYLQSTPNGAILEELRRMSRGGVKAETEALAPSAAALCDVYLPSKIIQGEFLG